MHPLNTFAEQLRALADEAEFMAKMPNYRPEYRRPLAEFFAAIYPTVDPNPYAPTVQTRAVQEFEDHIDRLIQEGYAPMDYWTTDAPRRRQDFTQHVDYMHREGLLTDDEAQNIENPY